jgi:hypothetical protein
MIESIASHSMPDCMSPRSSFPSGSVLHLNQGTFGTSRPHVRPTRGRNSGFT